MKRMQRVFGDYDSLRHVDGWLGEDRRAAFLRHLATNPAEAERVATWTRQTEAIRAAFAGVELEPIPPALRMGLLLPPPRPGAASPAASIHLLPRGSQPASETASPDAADAGARGRVRHRIAISLASLALAAAVVLLALRALMQGVGLPREGAATPSAMVRATDAYLTYAAEPFQPDDNVSADASALATAMRRRSSLAIAPPDLSGLGWTLRASRLVPGVEGPAAFFIFANATDERLGLFVGRAGSVAGGVGLGPAGERGAALAWERGAAAYVITIGRTPDWLSRNGQRLRAAVDGVAS